MLDSVLGEAALAFAYAVIALLSVALVVAFGRVAALEKRVMELRRATAREQGRKAALVRRRSVTKLGEGSSRGVALEEAGRGPGFVGGGPKNA